MKDPTRLLLDPTASTQITSLLSAVPAPQAPSAAKEAELVRHLMSLPGASAGAAAAAGVALWVKAALFVGVLGASGIWAVQHFGRTEVPVPPLAIVHNAVAPTIPSEPKPNAEALVPAPAAVLPAAPVESVQPVPAVRSARDRLADEEALLEQARSAASSSPKRALGLLQQYQRRFPNGQLTAERMFLGVDVLTRLGNTKAAQKQADALIRAFPGSVYASQVRARSTQSEQ